MKGSPQITELVAACARFTTAMKCRLRPRWLSMLGRSGTGKTHCQNVIFSKSRSRFNTEALSYIPHVIYWPAYVEEMRERTREGSGLAKFLEMSRWPLLALDDIGAERDTTGFASEKLNMLLGQRVGKWTILTSNLDLEGIAKVDSRIASRMQREPGNELIVLTCKSYAERQAQG